MDLLLVGLGNPGSRYEGNRHNVGFKIIELIAAANASCFKKVAVTAEVSSFHIGSLKIVLAKPLTFMNLSGNAVRFLMDFYKISPEKIYVFHDDIDIRLGRVKIKNGGGNGGHNGIKSIDALVGNSYWRVRIGVSRPPSEDFSVSSYVLENFSKDEENILQNTFHAISENISLLFSDFKKLESKINQQLECP
ncbi:MAG: aminoacyl-tRNA hydrolase [Holosporaceae bacterium]|jgi:PTH1 family peptidyl-tRNA hydrolase|nr:aminoacyl-tRNA hydrolase [Holosporaceae bacterium]